MSRPVTAPVRIPEQRRAPQPSVLVVVATADRTGALPATVSRLRATVPDAGLLVVDDGSPEGTGRIADALAGEETGVHVLHRAGNAGLGTACVAAYSWALDRGYDVLVQMDADGPHTPEELPRLLAALTDADLVVASRPAPPDDPTPRWRDDYARAILRMDVRDATSGFRALRADLVRALPLREIAASGRSFPVEVVWRSVQAGFRVHAVTLAEDTPPADSALRRIVRCGLRGRR